MRRSPQLISERYMQNPDNMRRRPDGSWGAARPLSSPSFTRRFMIAWGVFTGKYDAVKWEYTQ